MGAGETGKRLISSVKAMLLSGEDPQKLTARGIAAKAKVNQAMINYCFSSKDALVKTAADEILAEEFAKYSEEKHGSPKERLLGLITHVCGIMVRLKAITRASVPYLMLSDAIRLPQELLPFIKAHYGDKKSEYECRVYAFELVYSLQLIFYRAEDFRLYSGLDIENEEQLGAFLKMQLDLFLTE